METPIKVLAAILALSVVFVIVITVTQNPTGVVKTRLIDNLWETTDKGEFETCCASCEGPGGLSNACVEKIGGDSVDKACVFCSCCELCGETSSWPDKCTSDLTGADFPGACDQCGG